MSKRAAFEETDEFCTCASPHFEVETASGQEGGMVVDDIIGTFCSNCKKPKAPDEEVDET